MKKYKCRYVSDFEHTFIHVDDLILEPESHSACHFELYKESTKYLVLSIEQGTERYALEVFDSNIGRVARIEVVNCVDPEWGNKKIIKRLYKAMRWN